MNNSYRISANLIRRFVISVVLTLIWYFVMSSVVKPLTSKQIVAFELAGTSATATSMIQEWKELKLFTKVQQSIYFDFVFLVLYSATLFLACIISSRVIGYEFPIKAGSLLSKIALLAGLCDAIENIAMLRTLSGSVTELTVSVAYWFASVKFLMLGITGVFVLVCLTVGGVLNIIKK